MRSRPMSNGYAAPHNEARLPSRGVIAGQRCSDAAPSPPPPVPSFVVYIGIELIGGFPVMIGLFAGRAAFICSGMMAVAYWMVHGPQALLPLRNGGEQAAHGSGIWCIDASRPT